MRFTNLLLIYFYISYCFATIVPDLSWDDNLNLNEAKERIMPEIVALDLKKVGSMEIAGKITSELFFAAVLYKDRFKQSLPVCKRCSELEMLLILERISEIGGVYSEELKNALENVRKKDNTMEGTLKEIEVEYEKKFKKPVPWWWVCQNEERLNRLKRALATNMPYPYYDSSKTTYNLGKAIAAYEMLFGKQPPEWNCSNEEYLERLESALDVEAPYLSREEEVELKINLKTEYEKKFGKQISDFELSVASVSLKSVGYVDNRYRISVIRTTTGAIVKYLTFEFHPHGSIRKRSGIKLNMEEWLDFLNVLYKCRINEWEKKYTGRGILDGHGWSLAILFSVEDNYELNISGYAAYPPNWDKFMKIMDGIKAKMK